jgi:hypothetical protein
LVINADKDKYAVRRGDIPNAPNIPGVTNPEERRRDGLMYLFCIVSRTTAKTHTMVTSIAWQINAIREVMIQKDSDVQAFNTHIQHLTNLYYAHKRQKVDEETMMTVLFDSYSLCKDSKFVTYIHRMKEDRVDNHLILTPEVLMDRALKQNQTAVFEKTWGVESNEQREIMNMSAQLVSLQQQVTDE